jgi:hypothetical protein
MKFQLQPPVEFQLQRTAIRFTVWVCHGRNFDV